MGQILGAGTGCRRSGDPLPGAPLEAGVKTAMGLVQRSVSTGDMVFLYSYLVGMGGIVGRPGAYGG